MSLNVCSALFCKRDVISKGGNAVDAAIATMICDGALCPQFKGLGGGFLMSIYNATTKKVMAIDARETAPSAANDTMFVKEPKSAVYGTYLINTKKLRFLILRLVLSMDMKLNITHIHCW